MALGNVIYLFEVICILQGTQAQLLKAQNRQVDEFTKVDHDKWTGTYTFIQGTDPQPGLIDKIAGGNGTKWDEDIRRLNMAVSGINNITTKPQFFFISGDLVDAFPGQEPYRYQQTMDVLDSLSDLQVPTMVISGNHDLLNTPTIASIEAFRQQWGDDYYSFYCGSVLYIALNSQYFYDSSELEQLAQDQLEWLRNQLQKATEQPPKHIVILMHIPLFLKQGDEDDDYFNIPLALRTELLHDFMDAGIEIIFSGHYHRNAGGMWTNRELTIESVVTSAIGAQLGEDESGVRVVTVGEDKITHKYYALNELHLLNSFVQPRPGLIIFLAVIFCLVFQYFI